MPGFLLEEPQDFAAPADGSSRRDSQTRPVDGSGFLVSGMRRKRRGGRTVKIKGQWPGFLLVEPQDFAAPADGSSRRNSQARPVDGTGFLVSGMRRKILRLYEEKKGAEW
jgi:hypothetical protein